MSHTGHLGDTPSLPFSGALPISRQCSHDGAAAALPRAGSQAWTVYLALGNRPQTYHELHASTGLAVTTLCARVGWLRRQALVTAADSKPGPCGTRNTIFRHTTDDERRQALVRQQVLPAAR